MRETCHRCHGDLPTGDDLTVFCPHCAAPQLMLDESFLAESPDGSAGQSAVEGDTTGNVPPPAPRQVDWQAALRCSALVAGIGAVLSVLALRVPGLSLLSTLWILTASMSTLALYQRRRPLAWMDASIGAQVGLTAGLSLILFLATSLAISGLVARFGLHAMAGFDTGFAQMIVQAKETAANSGAPTAPELIRMYDRPEFQAGLLLASLATSALFLLVYSTVGGALGGLLRSRRRARL